MMYANAFADYARVLKSLTIPQANACLHSIGMVLGDWNQIRSEDGEISWLSYSAPENAKELLSFARHVVGWLPPGEWKLVQFDNSAVLDPTEAVSISRVMVGTDSCVDFASHRTFLVEFGKDEIENGNKDLLLADLVFLLLLFESHAYFASSGSAVGQVLGIQDGTVHFGSRDTARSGAELLLRRFEREPLSHPKWVTEIVARKQAEASRS